MSTSDNNSNALPDKGYLYGVFERWNANRLDWQGKLERRAAHKALDIPLEDEVFVQANKSGLGWKELLVVGLIGLAAAYVFTKPATHVDTKPATHVDNDTDTQYRLRFGK